jgi:hypothetical protein
MNATAIVLAALTISAASSLSAWAAGDTSLGNDLKATIVLQGKPCDQIVNTQHNGDSDYTAACKDGNRYHVYVNAQGRVIVDKL